MALWCHHSAQVQDEWLVHGGYHGKGDLKNIFAFDFNSLSWSMVDLTGDALHPRGEGMVAYHDGALIGIGGGHHNVISSSIVCCITFATCLQHIFATEFSCGNSCTAGWAIWFLVNPGYT